MKIMLISRSWYKNFNNLNSSILLCTFSDKNGDGNVDFSEFIVTFTSFLASKSPQTEEAIKIETVGTEKKPGDVSPASSPSKTPLSSIKEESSETIDGVSSNGTCQVTVKVTSHDDKKPALGENQQVWTINHFPLLTFSTDWQNYFGTRKTSNHGDFITHCLFSQ